MKLKEYIKTHGTRKTAIAIVNIRVQRIMGISVHDLPDTYELCCIYDEIEDILINGDIDYGKQQIKDILADITPDFIESICF